MKVPIYWFDLSCNGKRLGSFMNIPGAVNDDDLEVINVEEAPPSSSKEKGHGIVQPAQPTNKVAPAAARSEDLGSLITYWEGGRYVLLVTVSRKCT